MTEIKTEKVGNRKLYIAALSVLSAFFVVALHMSGFWTFSPTKAWLFSNFIESFCYFPVPVFFMISGATLIDYHKRYSTKEFFRKRIQKTVIPFFAFSIFGFFCAIAYKNISPESLTVFDGINAILGYQHMPIYWFFPALFSIYLWIPVIAAIPEEKRKQVFRYIIAAGFLFSSLFPFLSVCLGGKIHAVPDFSFSLGAEHLLYVLIGFYIDRFEIPKKYRVLIYALGIFGAVFHFASVGITSFAAGAVDKAFKGYLAPHSVFYSSAVFLFFKNLDFTRISVFFLKIVKFFEGQTFGIYLVHMFVIEALDRIVIARIPDFFAFSYLYKTFGVVLVFCFSALLVKLLQKIPWIKHFVP